MIAQLFINRYPEIIQSDNGKAFTNKILELYLEEIELNHLLSCHIILEVKEKLKNLSKLYKNNCRKDIIILFKEELN